MYEFNYYNAAQPQIITSFKGNQKLILGGYRYNIHHVKEGIKTWRCVCAKKLTGARSWCKGRAETWDSDTKGIPKGEHNHQTEHDLAELEYFKSQLIFAAISDSTADLNLLIDEAGKFLSQGLNFGNRESMKKSLIVARKSAESGELKLGQQPHRSIKGVKRASVRSKASIPSSTLRSSSAVNKNLSTSTTSTIQSQSSQNVSHQTYSCSSPFSPNISSSSRNNNNSSGIGSSLSTSDCFDNSYFSSTNSQNNWNQNNSNFELPSSSGLLFNDGEASAAINAYGNVNMPSEQILAAALFAAAMIGSTQASQNSNYNHQQFQEANIDNNNSVLSSIPSKKARGNNALNITRSVTTNGGAMPISTSKINIPAQTNSLKRKGARVNGILQKLSNKAVTETNNVFSPAQQRLMEIKKEKNELNACFNTVNKNGEDEEDIKPLNPLAHKRLLVNVQTQTDDNFGGEIETKGCANKVENDDNNSNENGKVVLNGFNHLQSSPKRLICCCCFDSDKAEEGFNSDEFPVGCKKRSKLLLEKDEAAAADKYIKRDEKEMHLEIEEKD